MRIAIDIDKTLVDCKSFLYEIINSGFSNQYGNKKLKYFEVSDKNPNIRGIIGKISKMYSAKHYTMCDNSSEIINKLYNEGHEIILLSSRPKGKTLISALIKCINHFDIKFSKIIVACNNKSEYCKENNVDLLVDNSYITCFYASKNNVKTICYSKTVSKNIKGNDNLIICKNWNDIYENIKGINNNKKR